MKLVYSLINPSNENEHGNDVYNMFILSAIMSREFGYTLELYASKDVIDKIGKWYDNVYIVSRTDFKFYDDIKINIWENCNNETITIDGDVFLFKKLTFHTTFDKNDIVSVENFDIMPKSNNVLNALKIFNTFNPNSIVSEWDNKNTHSLNTGIVRWSEYSYEFKMYYIKKYKELRDWFLYNEVDMNKKSNLLKTYSSVSSHFICEHLLYQLLKKYNLNYDILSKHDVNNYQHWKGGDKFTSIERNLSIEKLLIEHLNKKNNRPIIENYMDLLNNELIKKIF